MLSALTIVRYAQVIADLRQHEQKNSVHSEFQGCKTGVGVRGARLARDWHSHRLVHMHASCEPHTLSSSRARAPTPAPRPSRSCSDAPFLHREGRARPAAALSAPESITRCSHDDVRTTTSSASGLHRRPSEITRGELFAPGPVISKMLSCMFDSKS